MSRGMSKSSGGGSEKRSQAAKGSRPRRKHSKEFKLEAVMLSRQPGMTVAQAARDLGIRENMLHRWRSEFRDHADRAFGGHGNRRESESELERLRRENEQLRLEREILKKAAAFFTNQPPGDLHS